MRRRENSAGVAVALWLACACGALAYTGWDTNAWPSEAHPFAHMTQGAQANSAAVERCRAVGVTLPATNANAGAFDGWWIGKKRAKLVNAKNQLKAAAPHYIKAHMADSSGSYNGHLATGGTFSALAWTPAALCVYVGAPTNWFDVTGYFSLDSDSNGYRFVQAVASCLVWTASTAGWGYDGATNNYGAFRYPPTSDFAGAVASAQSNYTAGANVRTWNGTPPSQTTWHWEGTASTRNNAGLWSLASRAVGPGVTNAGYSADVYARVDAPPIGFDDGSVELADSAWYEYQSFPATNAYYRHEVVAEGHAATITGAVWFGDASLTMPEPHTETINSRRGWAADATVLTVLKMNGPNGFGLR